MSQTFSRCLFSQQFSSMSARRNDFRIQGGIPVTGSLYLTTAEFSVCNLTQESTVIG